MPVKLYHDTHQRYISLIKWHFFVSLVWWKTVTFTSTASISKRTEKQCKILIVYLQYSIQFKLQHCWMVPSKLFEKDWSTQLYGLYISKEYDARFTQIFCTVMVYHYDAINIGWYEMQHFNKYHTTLSQSQMQYFDKNHTTTSYGLYISRKYYSILSKYFAQ